MRITVCLTDRVTEDALECAKAHNLTLEQILRGPGRVSEMVRTMKEVGGQIVIRQDRTEGGSLIQPLPLPSIGEFRKKPGIKVMEGSFDGLAGDPWNGTVMEVNYPEETLKEMATLLQTDSTLETYSYGLWVYLALLRTAREYEGAVLGVYSDRENRFYSA